MENFGEHAVAITLALGFAAACWRIYVLDNRVIDLQSDVRRLVWRDEAMRREVGNMLKDWLKRHG